MGDLLSEADKDQWAAISAGVNKAIKDERDSLIDQLPTHLREIHPDPIDSRHYLDEDGYISHFSYSKKCRALDAGLKWIHRFDCR